MVLYFWDTAPRSQEQGQRMLSDALGVGIRRIQHANASGLTRLEVDVVGSCRYGDDQLQVRRVGWGEDVGVEHGQRDGNDVGISDSIADLLAGFNAFVVRRQRVLVWREEVPGDGHAPAIEGDDFSGHWGGKSAGLVVVSCAAWGFE